MIIQTAIRIKFIVSLLLGITLFSSCFTAFHVGQDAATLPKHTMELSGEWGIDRLNGGVRYGLLDKLDLGFYYGVDVIDERKKVPLMSGDIKYKLLGGIEKHYAISTGLGFGSGIEYLYSWNETQPHRYEEDVWYHYGGTSVDGYLPLYISGYISFPHSVLSITYNPYLIYRFGFYDHFHPGGYYDQYNKTMVYRNMGKGIIGNAISISGRFKRATMYGVFNLHKYLNTGIDPEVGIDMIGEFYVGISYRFNLGKKAKQGAVN